MRWPLKPRHTVGAILAFVLIAAACVWRFELIMNSRGVPRNSILIIAPYRYEGTWVFDDPNVGLVREPFVAGVPEMIDHLV